MKFQISFEIFPKRENVFLLLKKKKKILKKLEIMAFLPLFLHYRQDFRQDFRLTTLSICCFDDVSSIAIASNSLFLHSFLSFLEISIVKSDF